MNHLIKVLCINIFTNMSLVNSRSLNFTNLLMNYLTMCGPGNFCDVTQFNYTNLDFKISKSHKLCPDCFCDNLCFGRGDCCPDKYLAHSGLVCYNVTFVNGTLGYDDSRNQRSSFLMIKNCRHGTNQLIKEKCEKEADSVDKLRYPPVTSVITNLTYANRFCAQCNDERSYQFWNMDINCILFLDINFLSSFKEVVDRGIEHVCDMQFAPHDDRPAYNCYHLQGFHFDTCNKTGFWKTRNDDVLYGCESTYVNNDTFFKNPFCRMCNPTFYEGEVITRCNVTGLWDFFDENIKQACSRFGLNEGTLPFKNIFCRICNAPEKFKYKFVDASAKVNTKVLLTNNGNDIYYMSIKINKFRKDYFNFVTNNIPQSEHRRKQRTSSILFHNNQTLNVTTLMYKLISFKKNVRVCNNHGIPKSLSSLFIPCSCNPSCLHYNDCCEDFLLQYPTECIHSKQLAGEDFKWSKPDEKYVVTNGCYMQFQYAMYMEKLCKNGAQGKDIFSFYPVRDINTGVSYLNMYCYLCNTSPQRPVFDLGKPWDIEMYCEKYIDHRNFMMINQLVLTIKETNCNVTYLPISSTKGKAQHSVPRCLAEEQHFTKNHINKCNLTGKWLIEDPEIKYACENVSTVALRVTVFPYMYECIGHINHFCEICNPEVIENITISECNITGNTSFYDHRDEVGCRFFPPIGYHSPYKNLFCKHCNNVTENYSCSEVSPIFDNSFWPKIPNWTPIFRNLFLYSEQHDDFLEESLQCKSTETYMLNLKQCRNLTCYPGKYLRNGTCQALFTITKNLGYFMTSDFQGNVSSLLPVYELLGIISENINHTIISTLQIGLDSIEYFFVQIDEPCFKKYQMLSSHQFSGTIAVGFFIKQAVERVNFERRLFSITTTMKIFRIYPKFNLHLSLTMRTNQIHFNPYKIYLAEYFSRCTLPQFVKYQVVADRQHYRTVRISKLLTCVQVSLDFDEYRIDQLSGKLTIFGLDKIYDNDLFDNLPDGSARICAEDFNTGTDIVTFSLDKRNQDFLLSKITLILNVISILCLMISFLIYLFKKNLRTTPGKINMVLILSLVLTLTVFQLSKIGSSQKVACVGIGIALHYFWLMSFSTMTVSSFHMYRIFNFSNINTSNDFNNILIVYIAFITIFPCVVVVLNIIISWQISGDGDIGYGNRMCFIDNTYSRLASFIIPIGVMCICSLFFFVRTIISIKLVPKVPGNQSVRNEFIIFCRLFTITGITWALQIIDGFLPFSAFSYISSIINSLQGTAIFIAFSLNKRVMNCICTGRNDSHDNTQAKGESTEESNTDVTRL